MKKDSALLADEMGLGKTVQTVVAINLLFETKQITSVLIICPTSLQLNWKRELSNWCPGLSTSMIQGNFKNRSALYIMPFHVWIVSYDQIRLDTTFLNNLKYDLVILDEAQKIKNKYSKVANCCKLLNRKRSWALSGTPIENNIEELIAIFSFLRPNTLTTFQSVAELRKSAKPYFLRRTKKDVMQELPPIINQEMYFDLSEAQQKIYNQVFSDQKLRLSKDSELTYIFSTINKLKLICNFEPNSKESTKYIELINIIEKAISNKKKVILFSQFVSTLKTLKFKLQKDLNIKATLFHGGLNQYQKEKTLNDFEESGIEFKLMLVSLKAGGVGLNLNAASIVVIFDMWWNPAVEDQAIQRAHRFGKEEPLHVVKFIINNSIEEKILKIINSKRTLFDNIINKQISTEFNSLTKRDLIDILT